MKRLNTMRGLVFGAAIMAPALVFAQDDDGPPPAERLSPALEALDTNHDGQVSAEELKNAAESLGKLDHNKDGILDRAELEGPREGRADGPPPRRGPEGRRPEARREDGPPPPRRGPGGPPPEARDDAPPRRGPGGPEAGPPPRRGPREDRGPGPRGEVPPRREGNRPLVGQVLPPFAHDSLRLSPEQQEKIDALEKEVKGKLESILTPDQVEQLQNEMRDRRRQGRPGGGPDGPGPDGPPRGGRPGGPPPRQ